MILRLVMSAKSYSNPRRSQLLSSSAVRLLSSLSSSSDKYTPPQVFSGDDTLAKLRHKDWLAPYEVLKIFECVKDPSFLIPAYEYYSKRKDYQPTESLYALVISSKLGQAKMFDEIEEIMRTIKLEKGCRFSEEFFYNLMRTYGNLAGRIIS